MLDIKLKLSEILINKLFFTLNTSFIYPTLKFYFRPKILHVILAKNYEEAIRTPWNLLLFQTMSISLVIFDGNIDFKGIKYLGQHMHRKYFVNLLALQYSLFETNSEYYKYDMFGEYFCTSNATCNLCGNSSTTILGNKTIYNNHSKIFQYRSFKTSDKMAINAILVNEFPRSQMYSTSEEFGYHVRILEAFANYINVSFSTMYPHTKRSTEKSRYLIADYVVSTDLDFTMNFDLFAISEQNLEEVQKLSTVLEWMPWMIIVPSPRPISLQEYILKPFDGYIWLVMLSLIIICALVKRGRFWSNFCDFWRASLGQS